MNGAHVCEKCKLCSQCASRRANSVVINDAVGEPIRVCLKYVHGCLTEPSLKIIWIEQLRQSNFCQSTELQRWLCLPPSCYKFLSCIYRLLTLVATIVEVTSGTIDHEDASSSTGCGDGCVTSWRQLEAGFNTYKSSVDKIF